MIPLERIGTIAELFDRYNNALDPLSLDCLEAKEQFEAEISNLHVAHAPEVDYGLFRYELVKLCREYLRKN